MSIPQVIRSLHNQGPAARQVPLTPSKTSTSPRMQRQTSAQKLRGILRAVSQRIITPTKEEHTLTVTASVCHWPYGDDSIMTQCAPPLTCHAYLLADQEAGDVQH
jgi:hypothetical protein